MTGTASGVTSIRPAQRCAGSRSSSGQVPYRSWRHLVRIEDARASWGKSPLASTRRMSRHSVRNRRPTRGLMIYHSISGQARTGAGNGSCRASGRKRWRRASRLYSRRRPDAVRRTRPTHCDVGAGRHKLSRCIGPPLSIDLMPDPYNRSGEPTVRETPQPRRVAHRHRQQDAPHGDILHEW